MSVKKSKTKSSSNSLESGAQTILHLMKVDPLDKVLIVTDTKMLKIGKAIFDEARKINLNSVMLVMEPATRSGEEPPEVVAHTMKNANVIIAPTFRSLTHTKATKDARKAGARVATLPEVPEFSFTQGGLTADYTQVEKLTMRMHNAMKGSKKVSVKSKSGSDFSFSTSGREWVADTGIIHKSGDWGNLPAGEVFCAPIEDSVNGKIVFDSFYLSDGRCELVVKDGKVVEVKGKADKLLRAFDELGEKARQIAEFGIGTNPSAKVIGNTLEDEKVMDTVHVALGNNVGFGGTNDVQFHYDGIIEEPTVEVDGRLVIRSGKWLV